jgi:ParB-like chromosome segregation protein Spo0J
MPEDNFHPLANLFPSPSGDDFTALVDDVRANGLREPIWRHKDGRIIDGRTRWRACQEAGIACPSKEYQGNDESLLAFVVSMNVHRRHLDASQRAMIAAELATLGRGGDRRSEDFKASIDALNAGQAAKLLNVSEASVERAKAVRRDGVPELVRAVEQGQLAVSSAAMIAKAEPARQRRIVAGDEPVAQLVPEPESRPDDPDDVVGRMIRVTYTEAPEPTTIRISAYVTEPEPPPPIHLGMVTVTPPVLYDIFKLLASMPLSPEQAVEALPDGRRDEFAQLARQRQAWLTEVLRRLDEEVDIETGSPPPADQAASGR